MKHLRASLGAIAAIALSACAGSADAGAQVLAGDRAVVVAAASDLRPPFEALGELFTVETGHEVVFDFGSSGQLAQRVIEGSPADVFASADVSLVDEVLDAGRGDPDTKATYAFGRITIWASAGGWGGWATLDEVVQDEAVEFLAIANPEHAPYGRAAQQALEASDLWEAVGPKLVYGENISDTQRLAANGDADAAIVALSLAIAAGNEGQWVLIDESLHAPLEQALVVVADDPGRVEAARGFAELVNSPEGREVMVSFGFVLPGEPEGDS
jgi:molybdate transport system substrate-binding protein